MDSKAVSATSVGAYFQVNGSTLSKHYKNHLSGFYQWDQIEHAEEWILYPENIGAILCLDEVSLSDGELYTVLTNAKARCQKGSLIAMIKGVKSSVVCEVLNKISCDERIKVREISVDMANNMEKIARTCFPSAIVVTDRFHVAQLISQAVQEIRIKYRWEAINQENQLIKKCKQEGVKYKAYYFENGDSRKQLLARSRYILFKTSNKWTSSQKVRAEILFREYPKIKEAYDLSMMFRNIYETSFSIQEASEKLTEWYIIVKEKKFDAFITAAESISNHEENILNFFRHRTTNALAESFNSKVKAFRSVFRGVKDTAFFLFRLSRILA
jgi:transposase